MMERILSGIQPTGDLQLGNYLGAIKNWRPFVQTNECLFFIVDLHAITTGLIPPEIMRERVRKVAATYVACGIDPDKAILFVQSYVPAHCELAWILGCMTPLGWLNRMTQFKEKSSKNKEGASLGLYSYPVLQAADILLYKSTHVPVGADQKQHLELARDIAEAFNRAVGTPFFPSPQPCILGPAPRVMSLRDGTSKMSKSDPVEGSRINLVDDNDTIAQKIRKAKTDALPLPEQESALADRPEASNLVNIFAAVTNRSVSEILAEVAGQNFAAFKQILIEALVAELTPIRSELLRLEQEPDHLDAILTRGGERAQAIATHTLSQVRDMVGLSRL